MGACYPIFSQVAQSNARCLADGGSACTLNYEASPNSFTVTIRTQDNGSPPLYADFPVRISLTNINDQPRNLKLSGYTIKENSPKDTVVGTLSSTDEDVGQTVTYSLSDSDGGRFAIKNNKYIVSAQDVNYETTVSHKIVVVATDSGSPAMKVRVSSAEYILTLPKAVKLITYVYTFSLSI